MNLFCMEIFNRPPAETAIGALLKYVTTKEGSYQPMNINFGLFLGPEIRIRDKKKRNQHIIDRALEMQEKWLVSLEGVK